MNRETIRLEFYIRCPGCNYVSHGKETETETEARDYPMFCPNCGMTTMPELKVHEVNTERGDS